MLGSAMAVIAGSLGEVFGHLHPAWYPFVPYWVLIWIALFLSNVTMIIPQGLLGKLSWPRKRDFPDEWTIHGKRYNLRPFFDQHPGGQWVLRAAKGSDCTGLFESCHVFIDREVLFSMLARYEIKDGVEASKPVMVYSDPFYEDVKAAVRKHFKGQKRGAHKMVTPNLLLCFAALGTYWLMIYRLVVHSETFLVVFIGFLSWYLLGNIVHDCSHNALTSSPWVNRVLAHAAFPYGINISCWTIEHVLCHHIYPNMEDHDVDLYHFEPVLSLKKGKGTVPYALHVIRLAYLLSTAVTHLNVVVPLGIVFGFVDPAHGHAMYDRIENIQCLRAEFRRELIMEMVAQVAFWLWFANHQGFIKALLLNMCIFTVSSYLFSFFTQVSHLQESCHPDSVEFEKLSFAKRQIKTSVDFSPECPLWGHISGGLNTQAIHHCVPSVSAMHLRALYPAFRQVCKKHGVELKEARSLSDFVLGFVHFSN